MEENSLYRQAFNLIVEETPIITILERLGADKEVTDGICDGYCHAVGLWLEKELKELGTEYMIAAADGVQAAVFQVKFKKAMK